MAGKVTSVTHPSNLADGDTITETWVDAVTTSIEGLDAALGQQEPVAISTSLLTVSNTTETALLSFTVGAGVLGAANAIEVAAFCRAYNTSGNGDTSYTFRLKYGSSTLVTLTNYIEDGNFSGGVLVQGALHAAGATVQRGVLFSGGAFDVHNVGLSRGIWNSNYGTSAENSAGALTFSLTVQFPSAPGTARFYRLYAKALLIDVS